jgi:GT2 family glycosyltransferase
MNWKYYNPKFEYEEEFDDSAWPWVGHRYFAYDLIANIKPKVVVELGTHYGTSLWSFSQAVKDLGIDTELNAVDTWLGDKHASFYGEEVFETVNQIKDKYYKNLKLNLIRKTFDKALSDFEDNSVDILHIDGLHTYEAIKHDFENWLPKLNKNGIIIIHDIKVRELDFGVYKLWEELREKYSIIEFHQSFGLGVLFLDKNFGQEINKKEDEWQMHYSYIHETRKILSIKDKGQDIQQKDLEIKSKDQIILLKEQDIQQKVQKINSKNHEIDSKINELSLIYSSRAWKLILLIRELLNYFIPVGSHRRKIAGYIYRFFKKTSKSVYRIKKLIPSIFRLTKKGLFVFRKEGLTVFLKKIVKKILFINNEKGENINFNGVINSSQEVKQELKKYIELRKNDNFDILIFSIIPYKYRHQRPQHLAEGMANKNHRVFWIENSFIVSNNKIPQISIEKENDNLFIVRISSDNNLNIYNQEATKKDVDIFIKSIKLLIYEANIINPIAKIDHPFWQCLINKISMPIVYDCMDNHVGFDNNFKLKLKEENLIKNSNLLITTSNYLFNQYKHFNKNNILIRNACEFDFFNKFEKTQFEKPKDLQKGGGKKIIGYYGALANWFDLKILENIAIKHFDKEVVLIGNCSYQPLIKLAQKYHNIHLLGEKNYKDLPSYLYFFDVCIIPFVLNDLIKATDPVKLYEYFAMGKKVVATKMPEILKFKEYLWFAEGSEDFSNKIEIALNHKDTEEEVNQRIKISQKNTWSDRCNQLEKILKENFFPKVTVITLSYNQLHFTKEFLTSYLDRSFYPNRELIIVDNGSNNETVNYLKNIEKKTNQNIKIFFNKKNLGFGGGNNLGMKNATGDFIILINNDTKITPGWISRLVFHVSKFNVGLVGPVTNNIGNEAKIDIKYRQEDQVDIEKKALKYKSDNWGEKLNLKRIAAFCWILSKQTFSEIGGFDERFFPAYFEDDDYCLRVKNAGYEIFCVSDVFIHHFENGSVSSENNKKWLLENKKKFNEKWGENTWTPHEYRKDL